MGLMTAKSQTLAISIILLMIQSVSCDFAQALSTIDRSIQTEQRSTGNNSRGANQSELENQISTGNNPHWNANKCVVCHQSTAVTKENNLSKSKGNKLCMKCHGSDIAHKYIHPSGIYLSETMKKRMNKAWNIQETLNKKSQLTCLTCHDVLNQCLSGKSYMKQLNHNFLRDGPYSNRTEICYKCHDIKKYKKLSPHKQIESNGTLNISKCGLCHVVTNRKLVKSGIKRELSKYPIISELDTDRTLLCIRCHKKIDHPTSAFKVISIKKYRHFVKITDEKKQTLERMEAKTGIVMPLEPETQRIYCGTCHEPHQPGVFNGEMKTSMQGTKHRLRANNLCAFCHDK